MQPNPETFGRGDAEETDHRDGALLRPRRHRPRRSSAPEQHDELAPSDHSMTSSVSASSVGGIASPSALAVLRLTTSSSLFTCSTGNSAGLTPLRIRPVYMPPLW